MDFDAADGAWLHVLAENGSAATRFLAPPDRGTTPPRRKPCSASPCPRMRGVCGGGRTADGTCRRPPIRPRAPSSVPSSAPMSSCPFLKPWTRVRDGRTSTPTPTPTPAPARVSTKISTARPWSNTAATISRPRPSPSRVLAPGLDALLARRRNLRPSHRDRAGRGPAPRAGAESFGVPGRRRPSSDHRPPERRGVPRFVRDGGPRRRGAPSVPSGSHASDPAHPLDDAVSHPVTSRLWRKGFRALTRLTGPGPMPIAPRCPAGLVRPAAPRACP